MISRLRHQSHRSQSLTDQTKHPASRTEEEVAASLFYCRAELTLNLELQRRAQLKKETTVTAVVYRLQMNRPAARGLPVLLDFHFKHPNKLLVL